MGTRGTWGFVLDGHAAHIAWCKENGRNAWLPAESKYKAIQRVATWPLDSLPTDLSDIEEA